MKFLRLIPIFALFVAFGCSGDKAGQAGPTAQDDTFKVGLITPGPVSDAGWNAMAFDALNGLKSELNAEVNNQEATGTRIKDAMRSYAQNGYDLVFGHGFEYNEPALDVAKDFPETMFVTSSGGGTAANVGAFRFYLEQGFYLAGMTAALMSKTGKVGVIGYNVPSIKSTFDAFKAGAKAARPDIDVREVLVGEGADVAAFKQGTLSLADAGVDMIIHQANQSGQAVFNAAKERNILAFGSNLNQNDNPSGVVIGSAIIVAKPAFLDLAKQVKEGSFKGQIVLMGMDKGAIDYVWNPALEAKVPADVKTKVEEARQKILEGTLTVPKAEF